jgi:hypothetical protein
MPKPFLRRLQTPNHATELVFRGDLHQPSLQLRSSGIIQAGRLAQLPHPIPRVSGALQQPY